MNIHWIPTKLGTAICLNEPFTCSKFQPDWIGSCIRVLWQILQGVRTEEKEK